ncbi:catechol 2,3-dioxygenase-like lactoylglutathione lyase family enzyme [Saccharopolyspora lacisalsi]|uniref:Catechol 2,3-dioxygenase-like lactoylglutathione lyase family enzyme n=1 Tax=Halosaccharopolyspora lacisalsi TaxID=1000566 RepID=A0A839DQ58_9PSEU|nr:VOC family protein [Halosaccharopolyspora lacisalsi]MBA8822879.1 catechol 2,3-dioxygenase-like lactoylglutathione lyase family enzyme [Halosaccharopolyspora lacisalsi]
MTMQFSALGLVADDMAKTLAFYRLLGLDIPAGADAEPHVDVIVPGGVRLMWDTAEAVRSIDPTWKPPSGGHRVALAFDCGSPAAVDSAYAEITAAGHAGHHAPWDAPWGQRYATVLDPDGNPVDLFATFTS